MKDQVEEHTGLFKTRQKPLGNDQVTRTADGQKLRETLKDAEKNGFRKAQRETGPPSMWCLR